MNMAVREGEVDHIEPSTPKDNKEESKEISFVDRIIEKAISRKLLVWLAATILMLIKPCYAMISKTDPTWDIVTENNWAMITLAYVCIQGTQDTMRQVATVVAAWKGGKMPNIPAPAIFSISPPAPAAAPSPDHEADSNEEEGEEPV